MEMREIIEELQQKYEEGYRYWNQGSHYITEVEYVELIVNSSAIGYVNISFAIQYLQNDLIFQQI